ncbi:MAG TPA: DUF2935 domain-containing protein [Micromonosporaceae bacterium]|nr:DUF2935 domain-containing protein [Micromonosporaceae bacterium]
MSFDAQLVVHTRGGGTHVEEPFEKAVPLPRQQDQDPARHAWSDARFAADIMAEHGTFFAMLMPPELAGKERAEALRFADTFGNLHRRIAAAPPPEPGDLKSFVSDIVEQIRPFIDYKATMGDAQRNGTLRSLVWPLFFDPSSTVERSSTTRAGVSWLVRVSGAGDGDENS